MSPKGRSGIDRYRDIEDGEPPLKAICVVGRSYWYWDYFGEEWAVWPRTYEFEEVIGYLSGILNTYSRIAETRGVLRYSNTSLMFAIESEFRPRGPQRSEDTRRPPAEPALDRIWKVLTTSSRRPSAPAIGQLEMGFDGAEDRGPGQLARSSGARLGEWPDVFAVDQFDAD